MATPHDRDQPSFQVTQHEDSSADTLIAGFAGVGLAGIPYPHGPADHSVFYVATEDYQDKRLHGTDISAMGQGFLDGVNARLIARRMDSALRTGVFVTPVHAQAPDVDAAIRLLGAVNTTYGLDIDPEPLEQFATEVQQYYAQLAERLRGMDEETSVDRMFM